MIYTLNVNGESVSVDAEEDTPLLWVLRDNLGLNGTKYGCGIGKCGACMVQVDGNPKYSCISPIRSIAGSTVTTIEGFAENNHPVIAAFIEERVPQCGYCQPGMVISAISLLQSNPNPADADINQALSRNLCRCGTYQRVRSAIHNAAQRLIAAKT